MNGMAFQKLDCYFKNREYKYTLSFFPLVYYLWVVVELSVRFLFSVHIYYNVLFLFCIVCDSNYDHVLNSHSVIYPRVVMRARQLPDR